jgi:hypothetical protein
MKSDAGTVAEIVETLRKVRAMHVLFKWHNHTLRGMLWFGLVWIKYLQVNSICIPDLPPTPHHFPRCSDH